MKSVLELLLCFLRIGLLSIGGGYATLPLIQEQIVENKHWLTFQEFTDIITISQMTPGPLAVNASTFVGIRIAGLAGALAATSGCVVSGVALSIMLHHYFQKHKNSQTAIGVLKGLRAVSIGLIAASSLTILSSALLAEDTSFQTIPFNIRAVLIFLVSIIVLRKWKVNTMLVIVLSGIAGLILY